MLEDKRLELKILGPGDSWAINKQAEPVEN
jgi:hypothetical protein